MMTVSDRYIQKQLSTQEISFYHLLHDDPNFDVILFPEKIEGQIGYFPSIEQGNLLGKEKQYWLLTMQAIAKFHHYIKTQPTDSIGLKKSDYAQSLANVIRDAAEQTIELPAKQMSELDDSLELIGDHLQLIHDDFLPQNVIVDQDEIKIIDWEDMTYGFAEHDVGRFLGDLHHDLPTWNKKYYPSDWHDELRYEYLHARSELDAQYDVELGKQLIRLGEMWNYLGPIEMSLKRKDTDSDWFRSNLQALSEA